MGRILNFIENRDITVFAVVLLLMLVGSLTVFSTTFFPEREVSDLFFKQVLFYGVGFSALIVFSFLNYSYFLKGAVQLGVFLATVGLLVLVLMIGVEIYGAKRWIDFAGVTIQASEFSKLAIILCTSYLLHQYKNYYRVGKKKFYLSILNWIFSKRSLYLLGLIGLISTIFILIFLQNSLGNSLINLFIFGSIIFFNIEFRDRFKYYFLIGILSILLGSGIIVLSNNFLVIYNIKIDIVLIVLLLFFCAFLLFRFKINIILLIASVSLLFLPSFLSFAYENILADYQRGRIETYLNPDEDSEFGSSWNREQALIAIGSAGALGKGLLQGTQTNYQYLPFSYTDFAYAAIVEQFGFIGSVIIFSLFIVLFWRLSIIIKSSNSAFGKNIAIGVTFMIFFNFFQHIGMNLGVLPITGVPLPLISYGGSSIIVTLIGIGLCLSIYKFGELERARVSKIDFKSAII